MSRKKPANSGWESDEEDLLMNDGGISAFKNDDDDIDEEALLGLEDENGTGSRYLHTGNLGNELDFQQQEDEMLEIAVNEEEIEELVDEDQKRDSLEEEAEQLDYNDDLPQTEDVQLIYDDSIGDANVSEADVSHGETEAEQHSQTERSFEYSHDDSAKQSALGVEELRDSESESDDSGDEKQQRGRFKSERSNIVNISKTKSRTDIPETLEVSAEQNAQLEKFPESRRRDRSSNDRGRGGASRGRGGRNDHQDCSDKRMGVTPMNRGQHHQNRLPFQHNQMRPMQPLSLMGQDLRPHFPYAGDRISALQFGRGASGHMLRPQGMMSMAQDQGNRFLLRNQDTAFHIARPHQRGVTPLLPGQTSLLGSLPQPFQRPPQLQHPNFRSNIPESVTSPRPHNIHINPNFRGTVTVSSVPPVGQPQPLFSQPTMSMRLSQAGLGPGDQHLLMQDGPRPLLLGQPQGFRAGPMMGVAPHQPGIGLRHGQPQPSRFPLSANQVLGQPVLMGSPLGHPSSSTGGFPGQRLDLPHTQGQSQFSHPFNNQPSFSLPIHQQNTPNSPRFHPAQQNIFLGPSVQNQMQPRPRLFASRTQRRLGLPVRGADPQKLNTMTMAKKLSQQARITQQVKAVTQSVNKNITVVPLKRKASDTDDASVSPKVAKTTAQSMVEEPGDEELKRGLEEQKRLREMIKKRKEEARRRQAEVRRRELEERLAKQGKTLADIEGGEPGGREEAQPSSKRTAPDTSVSLPAGAQQIKTVVNRGGKKQILTKRHLQNRQQQLLLRQRSNPAQKQLPVMSQGQILGQQQYLQLSSHQLQQPPPSPGFSSLQQHPPPQLMQAPPPMSSITQQQSPFKQQPLQQAGAQRFQSPKLTRQSKQVPVNQFPQQFLPRESGDSAGHVYVRQHSDNVQNALVTVAGQGIARGQMASVPGRLIQGQMTRGRGQLIRGRGQVVRSRGGVALAASSQQVTAVSTSQPASNRTVIPARGGKLLASSVVKTEPAALVSDRMVVQRQASARPAQVTNKVEAGIMQKVSIDNLAQGTSEFEIRKCCEAEGPVLDIVMIDSQRKAIITFGHKAHAVLFAKRWNRRMVNLSMVTVTLLP